MEYMSIETFRLFLMPLMCGLVALFCLLFPLWVESLKETRQVAVQPVTRYQTNDYLKTKLFHEKRLAQRRYLRTQRFRLVDSVALMSAVA